MQDNNNNNKKKKDNQEEKRLKRVKCVSFCIIT